MNLRILRGGCVGDDVVYEASAGRGTDPGEPPMLAAGVYGFEATASASDGKVVAFVCTERTLPGDGPIELELASRSGACGARVDGGPSGSDAGDSDAGDSDAGGSDAGGQNTPDEGCGDLDADGCDDCSYSSTPDPGLDGPEIDADGLCDCVVFADASIVGQGDGKRWSTAFASLQAAVDRAAELGPDCEVWIRQGTYYGYASAVTDGLRLVRDIELYGGFVGGELQRDQRTQDPRLTLLDGRSRDSSGQRVAHVIIGADATRIEDLTIVGGDASGALQDGQGGGMLNVEVTTSLRNVVFRTNHAALGGGAMHNLRSNVTLTRCIFEGNTSGASGGAIAHEDGMLTVVRAQFRDNQAADALFGGGAIYQRNGTAQFENCLFARNDAVRWGADSLARVRPRSSRTAPWPAIPQLRGPA